MKLDLTWLKEQVDLHYSGKLKNIRKRLKTDSEFKTKVDRMSFKIADKKRRDRMFELQLALDIKACHYKGRSAIYLLPLDYNAGAKDYKNLRIVTPWSIYPEAKDAHKEVMSSRSSFEYYAPSDGLERYWNYCPSCDDIHAVKLEAVHPSHQGWCDTCAGMATNEAMKKLSYENMCAKKDTDFTKGFMEDILDFKEILETQQISKKSKSLGTIQDDKELLKNTTVEEFYSAYSGIMTKRIRFSKFDNRSHEEIRDLRLNLEEDKPWSLAHTAKIRGEGILSLDIQHSLWFLTWKKQGMNKHLSTNGVSNND